MNLNLRQVLPKRDETFELAPGIPPPHTSQLPWINVGAAQPSIFDLSSCIDRLTALTDIVVCNSFCKVEAGAFKLLTTICLEDPKSLEVEIKISIQSCRQSGV